MKTLIIAEAGVNHNGDMKIACQLIDMAAEAGADLIKFQTFKADQLVTPGTQKADYQKRVTEASESQYDMLKRLELTHEMHELLIEHCKKANIGFFSTGFDIASVKYLMELGLDRIKIPSGEVTNLPYLRYIGGYNKPIILSTGMATLSEIEQALEVLQKAGMTLDKITVLHCSTDYPAPMKDVNLLSMITIKDTFGVSVGYSDHTEGIEVSIAAVALGASIIEKHLTLDRNLPGPDHKASIEPSEFKRMVSAIRNIELARGDGGKKPSTHEMQNKLVVRKSIVAALPIQRGEAFTVENLTVKRPGTGISPMLWDDLLGKKASRSFQKDELIEL